MEQAAAVSQEPDEERSVSESRGLERKDMRSDCLDKEWTRRAWKKVLKLDSSQGHIFCSVLYSGPVNIVG